MKVAVQIDYKADRKEPFGALVRRIVAAFEDAGLEAVIEAAFSDSPVPGGVSAIDRALKKYPAPSIHGRSWPATAQQYLKWSHDSPCPTTSRPYRRLCARP